MKRKSRLTTDSWNTLVRLCAKRVSNEPDSAAKHLQQHPWQAYVHIRTCRPTSSVHCNEALRLAVNPRAGHRPDVRPEWKRRRPRDRSRQTWIRQLEIDVGFAADAAWDMASDAGQTSDCMYVKGSLYSVVYSRTARGKRCISLTTCV